MRGAIIACSVMLAACGDSAATSSAPGWADDVAAYCQQRDPRWRAALLDRIDRALPDNFAAGSLRLEAMNQQAPFDGRPDAQELQLRLAAQQAGQPVKLSAYGIVAPGSCAVRELEAIAGFDRFDPQLRFAVPD